MVTGVVSAVSSVIGNFQMYGMNKSLDILVNHTLRIFNVVFQSLQEQYDGKVQLFAKLDDVWKEIREGNTYGQLHMVVLKMDEFVIPHLRSIDAGIQAMVRGGNMPLAAAGGEGSFTIEGDVLVQKSNTPEQLVRELKSRRVVRGFRK